MSALIFAAHVYRQLLGIPIGEYIPKLLSVVAHELDTNGLEFCGFILVSHRSSFTNTSYTTLILCGNTYSFNPRGIWLLRKALISLLYEYFHVLILVDHGLYRTQLFLVMYGRRLRWGLYGIASSGRCTRMILPPSRNQLCRIPLHSSIRH